jgi:hypothetical protein
MFVSQVIFILAAIKNTRYKDKEAPYKYRTASIYIYILVTEMNFSVRGISL